MKIISDDLKIKENSDLPNKFIPYTFWDSCTKKLSVYLKDEEYYVESTNDEIEIFKSFKDNNPVGCRLDLSGKFIQVQQDDFK